MEVLEITKGNKSYHYDILSLGIYKSHLFAERVRAKGWAEAML